MTRAKVVTFRLLLFAALVAVTYLATTRHEYPVVKDVWDKANHILAFYVLALLTDLSFPSSRSGWAKVAVLLAYGLLIEVIQSFLPRREASLLDLAANGAGIAMCQLSLPLLRYVPLLRR
jgi:VanZ family protein